MQIVQSLLLLHWYHTSVIKLVIKHHYQNINSNKIYVKSKLSVRTIVWLNFVAVYTLRRQVTEHIPIRDDHLILVPVTEGLDEAYDIVQ